MEAFFVVSQKLLIMSVMIFVGWCVSRAKKITAFTVSEITWVLLNVVTPCVIVNSFANLQSGIIVPKNMLLCVFLSFMSIFIGVVCSSFLFKKESEEKRKVYRFAMTYSNASFMGIPLVQALVGSEGVAYASIFIAVFNFMIWTFGHILMSGNKKIKIKNILLNAGTIGLFFGLLIYIPQLNLPIILAEPLESITDLNTPLAMFIFGFYIANINLAEILTDKKIYLLCLLRLLVMPLLALVLLLIFKPTEAMFLSIAIQSAAPAATTTVLFAALLGGDAKLASKIVTATNVLCLISIPIYISFVQFLVNSIL